MRNKKKEKIVVSVSGGKDSTALYAWAIERYGKDGFLAVFADTGNEHPVTLNYLRNLPEKAGGPDICWVKADFTAKLKHRKGIEATGIPFLDLIIYKNRVPSARAQFCTEYLKMIPIRIWIEETFEAEDDVLLLTGIRRGESARRSRYDKREYLEFYECFTERPLIDWTEEDVFGYLKARGIEPNPLYKAGFKRVGCFPCIHAGKQELSRLPEWAWKKISEWEIRTGRSWFPAGKIPGIFIPSVDDVRQWSNTTRGGRQLCLWKEDEADISSCMASWGICE